MDSKTFIYALCHPTTGDVRYIGKSNTPERRLRNHMAHAKKKHIPYVYSWIRGLRKENLSPQLLIIDEVLVSEWKFWEQHYISLFKSWSIPLTNMTVGGDREFSDYERKQIVKKIGKPILQYSRDGIFLREWGSLSEAGRYYNIRPSRIGDVLAKKKPTTIDCNWRYKRSKKYPLKIRAVPERMKLKSVIAGYKKLSIFMTGRKMPIESIEKMRRTKIASMRPSHRRREIYQYDLSGKFIKKWNYINLASVTLKIIQQNITRSAISDGRKMAGGFRWSYEMIESKTITPKYIN